MIPDADAIADRRRLKRRLTFWRLITILAVLIAIIAAVLSGDGGTTVAKSFDHIARVRVEGIITDDPAQQKLLTDLAAAGKVKAVVLHVDSPGGTTAGSEALHETIRGVVKRKPVVAVLGTVAASGGYIAAIGADHIVARGNTTTGSIGVIFQWAEVKSLLDRFGVKVEEVKSAPAKGEPSPFAPLSEQGREIALGMVRDSYEWFLGLVAQRRALPPEEARRLGDGRVYTGRQAVAARLVDAIGGEETALSWLETEKKIAKGLKVLDYQPSAEDKLGFGVEAALRIARVLGLAALAEGFAVSQKMLPAERLRLDGLVSVWQAQP